MVYVLTDYIFFIAEFNFVTNSLFSLIGCTLQ